MTTAILAVQGAFAEHAQMIEGLGEPVVLLRQASDLAHPFERLVLPGGESTVQGKLLAEQGMLEPLRAHIKDGMPVLATCAGLILLARDIVDEGETPIPRFATLPICVRRNAYGRQLGSFHTSALLADGRSIPLTFIRAPRIESVDSGVETIVSLDGSPVAIRLGSQVACAFHPELDPDSTLHRLFLSLT